MKKGFSGQKVCVLGCGGFIGSHIVERLLGTTDLEVVGLDIASEKIEPFLKRDRFTFARVNVYDTDTVRGWIEGCGTVVSLVAICNPSLYNTIPLDVIEANFTRPMEIVRICAELNLRLIHFSTCEVYGKTIFGIDRAGREEPKEPDEYLLNEDRTPLILGPVSAQRWSYACAKQLLERAIYAYGFEKDLDFTIVRPFNFIGPRMDYLPGFDGEGIPRVLACFISSLLKGEPLKLVDGGKNRRCFTYIEDAVDAFVEILNNPEICSQQILNIGNPGNEVTIEGLARQMIEVFSELNPDREKLTITTVNVSSREFYGPGYEDSDRRVPDNSKIYRLLRWRPKTNLRDTLLKTMKYYIDVYSKQRELWPV